MKMVAKGKKGIALLVAALLLLTFTGGMTALAETKEEGLPTDSGYTEPGAGENNAPGPDVPGGCGADGCADPACTGGCQLPEAAEPAVHFTLANTQVALGTENFDLLAGVTATDENGDGLPVAVQNDGGFDILLEGSYSITYVAQHPGLGEVTAQRVVSVVAEGKEPEAAFVYDAPPVSRVHTWSIAQAYKRAPQANPMPRWEEPIADNWVPKGFVQVQLQDEATGTQYWTLQVAIVLFSFDFSDPNGIDIDSVQDLLDAIAEANDPLVTETDILLKLTPAFKTDWGTYAATIAIGTTNNKNITIDGGSTDYTVGSFDTLFDITNPGTGSYTLQNFSHSFKITLGAGAYTLKTFLFWPAAAQVMCLDAARVMLP